MTEQKQEITYKVQDEEVKLSPSMVKKYLVNGNGNVTDQEIVMFMQLCKFQKLNPFLNEAYLIKFGNSPAQIITSKEAFMKRADANPHYKGNKAGIIVQRGDEMKKLNGAIKLPTDTLLGGWAKVERDDRSEIEVEISTEEFGKGQSTWKTMPMNMIRKTALVNALREAFPENLGSLYTEDDKNPNEPARVINNNVEEKVAPQSIDDLTKDELKETVEETPKDTESDEKENPVKEEESDNDNSNESEEPELTSEEQQELFKGVGTEVNE